ncbi:MAG: glycosyltransferase family 2 protein [bacterium]|nr:glycosyltransferase family 2 protein [bacterium]
MDRKICIIVLNWNGREETLACLRSLREIDYADYSVVLVDNASTDGSADEIERLHPEVRLIRNPVNAGFDGGNNIGILAALRDGAEAVLLLNNDTIVCPGILRAFADADRSLPRAGILGPKIYYHERPSVFWWAGCRRTASTTGWLLSFTQEGKFREDHGQYDEIRKIDSVIGCAMYIRRRVIEEIGMLDERFFIYHEEYDFCQRAANVGWQCYFVPSARVWHKVSLSMGGAYSPSLYYLWTRNWLLVTRKQTPFILWPMLYAAYAREALWVYQGLVDRGKEDAARASLAGAWNALLNRYGPVRNMRPPALLRRLAEWHDRRGGREG